MEFEKIIESVGQRLGLENFALDENGLCELCCIHTTISIYYMKEKELVFVYAPAIEIPDTASAAFLRRLCEANFLFMKTRGMTLSISPETSMLVLEKVERTAALDDDIFYALLERFCSVFEIGLERIKKLLESESKDGILPAPHWNHEETEEIQQELDDPQNTSSLAHFLRMNV